MLTSLYDVIILPIYSDVIIPPYWIYDVINYTKFVEFMASYNRMLKLTISSKIMQKTELKKKILIVAMHVSKAWLVVTMPT